MLLLVVRCQEIASKEFAIPGYAHKVRPPFPTTLDPRLSYLYQLYRLVSYHISSRSWPLGGDSFGIGRHFHCQILTAQRWWRRQVGYYAHRKQILLLHWWYGSRLKSLWWHLVTTYVTNSVALWSFQFVAIFYLIIFCYQHNHSISTTLMDTTQYYVNNVYFDTFIDLLV
jgi:hypothetical protein